VWQETPLKVSMPGMFGIVGEDSIPMALTRKAGGVTAAIPPA